LHHFSSVVVPNSPPLHPFERALVDKSKAYDDQGASNSPSSSWKRMKNTINDPVSYFQKLESNSASWGKAVANIDTSVDGVFSWLWNSNTYERIHEHIEYYSGALFRKSLMIPNSHSMIYAFLVPMGAGFDDRVLFYMFSWERDANDTVVIAFETLDKQQERVKDNSPFDTSRLIIEKAISFDKRATSAIRVASKGFWKIEAIAPNVSRVSYVVQANIGGSIPLFLMNMKTKSMLLTAENLRDRFERNGEAVDAEMRATFKTPPTISQLNPDQTSVVNRCLALEAGEDEGWAELQSSSRFVDMQMKYAPPRRGERSVALGKARSIVDTSANLFLG
jgi:hypothetical protein